MRIEFSQLKKSFRDEWEVPKFFVEELTKKRHEYCLTIPVLNEGERIISQLKKIKAADIAVDVILADGGSTDGSNEVEILKDLNVRSVVVKTGPGKMSAQMRCAFAYALCEGYAGVINIDGNDKDEVTDINKHLTKLHEGYDCVLPSRYIEGGHSINTPLERDLAIRLLHAPLISLAAGKWMTDTTNSFRGYSRKFLLDERVNPFRHIFVSYNLPFYLSIRAARLGYKVSEVPTTRRYPESGEVPTKIQGFGSKVAILKELWHSLVGTYNP